MHACGMWQLLCFCKKVKARSNNKSWRLTQQPHHFYQAYFDFQQRHSLWKNSHEEMQIKFVCSVTEFSCFTDFFFFSVSEETMWNLFLLALHSQFTSACVTTRSSRQGGKPTCIWWQFQNPTTAAVCLKPKKICRLSACWNRQCLKLWVVTVNVVYVQKGSIHSK